MKIYSTFFFFDSYFSISPLRNRFPLMKIVLNEYFKNCFPVVTIFTSSLLIAFTIDLPIKALFLNLAFCLLILLLSFPPSLYKSVLSLIYGF